MANKGERAMAIWSGTLGIAVAAGVFWTAAAYGQTGACGDADTCKVATDRPAAVLIYPRIHVDPANGVDTVIQLTNTSEAPIGVRCSYLNTNGHCSNNNAVCRTSAECGGGTCVPGWVETDFRVTLTRLQPISWNASQGLAFLPCDPLSPDRAPCLGLNDGRILAVPETPFLGELRCVEVSDSDAPLDFNVLVGSASTIRADGSALDASRYNAIGVQAIPGANDHDNRLCLGGIVSSDACPGGAEYAGCPQTLLVDHFFEGAVPASSPAISSRLTVVPCGQDLFSGATPPLITLQFLVYNEFEQRTSTSVRFRCFLDRRLADIDTQVDVTADDGSSIFSINTQATLAGQTRISAVGTSQRANGVVAVLHETRACQNGPGGFCTTAVNPRQQGRRALSDVMEIP